MSLYVNTEYHMARALQEILDAFEHEREDLKLELKLRMRSQDDGWFEPPNGFNGIWIHYEGEKGYMFTSPEATEYFFTVGCECRPIFIPEIPTIMVSGQDDCPVHGFGE